MSVKKSLFILALILVVAVIVIYQVVTKPTPSLVDEVVLYEVNAVQFYQEFTQNQTGFQQKYINKAIGITGVITSVQDSIIVLNDKIVCITNNVPANLSTDQSVRIKGRYIGYDDLFDNLKLNECLLESL